MADSRRLTVKQVNAALESVGAKERLFADKNYFYFSCGNAARWQESVVDVQSICSLSIEQWVAEWRSRDAAYRTSIAK